MSLPPPNNNQQSQPEPPWPNMDDSLRLQVGDYVRLNNLGLKFLFPNGLSKALHGKIISMDYTNVTFEQPHTGETTTVPFYKVEKGMPDKTFWYRIAESISGLKEDSPFINNIKNRQLRGMYRNLKKLYEADTMFRLGKQDHLFNTISSYIENDPTTFAEHKKELDAFQARLSDSYSSTPKEKPPCITVGDDVMISDSYLTGLFSLNITTPLYGKVVGTFNNDVYYDNPDTGERGNTVNRWLQKGVPDKLFLGKVLLSFNSLLQEDEVRYYGDVTTAALREDAQKKHPETFAAFNMLLKKYRLSVLERTEDPEPSLRKLLAEARELRKENPPVKPAGRVISPKKFLRRSS